MTDTLPRLPKGAPQPFGTEFDTLFNRLLRGWPGARAETASGEPRHLRAFDHLPSVEVREDEKAYRIAVELPGLDEKDVKVLLEDDVLTISGEKRSERTDEKTHYSERSYGAFTRAFTLPPDADRAAIAAKFAKGVLTLEIAKSSGAPVQGKEIPIRAS